MVASPEICRLNGARSKGAITARGKAIAARNATKHGLLAEQPPILATEDLETFQGLMQNLVNDFQPEGAIEWHLVQTIAMCIHRQNRLWVAEAAIGNAAVLPAVKKPATDEKYPAFNQPQENERWSCYHPTNLRRERKLLTWFIEQNPLSCVPTERRSKFFAEMWQDWVKSTVRDLKRLEDEYPVHGIPGKPDPSFAIVDQQKYRDRYLVWIRDLCAEKHPFAECWFYLMALSGKEPPTSKEGLDYYRKRHAEILDICQKRIEQIEQVEQEMEREHDRYQQDLERHQALTANPIPQQVALLSRYESHISKQLERTLEQLQMLQKERKNGTSMGSFGKTSDTRLGCA